MENYDPLREIANGPAAASIYVSDGDWQETLLRRRMTVMKTSSGELVIHNTFELSADDVAKLRQLGALGLRMVHESIFLHRSGFQHR